MVIRYARNEVRRILRDEGGKSDMLLGKGSCKVLRLGERFTLLVFGGQ